MQAEYDQTEVFMDQLSARVRQLSKSGEFLRFVDTMSSSLNVAPSAEQLSAHAWLCTALGFTPTTAPPVADIRSLVVAVQLLLLRIRVIRERNLHEGSSVRFTNVPKEMYRIVKIRSTLLLDLGYGFPRVHPLWVELATP